MYKDKLILKELDIICFRTISARLIGCDFTLKILPTEWMRKTKLWQNCAEFVLLLQILLFSSVWFCLIHGLSLIWALIYSLQNLSSPILSSLLGYTLHPWKNCSPSEAHVLGRNIMITASTYTFSVVLWTGQEDKYSISYMLRVFFKMSHTVIYY